MIEEDQQYIILCTDEYKSLLSSNDETKQIQIYERQKGKICKQKNKKKQRLVWVPLIMKNILRADTEPVYVYNLLKMMKSYDNEQIERYHNYGIMDAGIGIFDSIQFDKVHQSIDISLTTFSIGQIDMNYLIQLYKSYQNQQYYNLALALQEYQDYSTQDIQFLRNKFSTINYNQDQIDEEFLKFVKITKEWCNNNLENEIYEVCLGNIDIEKGIPAIKKIIYSKNLILFIGNDISETYNELSLQRNFDFLTNFLKIKNTNELDEINITIKTLKESAKQFVELEMDEEIETLDGYKIPSKKKMKTYFYDIETGEIITSYSFEPKWIKYLIDQRLHKNVFDQEQKDNSSFLKQNMDENFEYVCQKEYFLEKFNYKPSKNH